MRNLKAENTKLWGGGFAGEKEDLWDGKDGCLGKTKSRNSRMRQAYHFSRPTRHLKSMRTARRSQITQLWSHRWLLTVETAEKWQSGVLRWVLGALGG